MQVQISWKKPLAGWMKLNTDGVVFGNSIQVGGGGVIRDSNGEWVAGFVRKLGSMSSILAELWALKDGLLLARQLDILNVNIELDADLIVHLLNNPSFHNLMFKPLLNDCKNLIKTFPSCTMAHVFRETNRCADKLANIGATQTVNFLL